MEGLIAIALLLVVPACCAWLLRSLDVTGWAILGGVVAGILLGPTLLGRIVPNQYEAIFIGGVEHREELHRLYRRQGADLIAAQHAGTDSAGLRELEQRHLLERTTVESYLNAARWDHQLPQRALAISLICVTLIGARTLSFAKHEPRTSNSTEEALIIGLWSATAPSALALMVSVWWWQLPIGEAAFIAAAVMIGPWALARIDWIAAERVERGAASTVIRAGYVASMLALIVAGWGLWMLHGWTGLLWLLPLLLLFAGLFEQETPVRPVRQTQSRFLQTCLQMIILPSLSASVMVKIELHHDFQFWPLLILLILSGDGRWIGSVIGTLSVTRNTAMQAMKRSLGATACGPTQLAMVAIAAHGWLLDRAFILALMAGVIYVQALEPVRRWFTLSVR